MKEYFVIGNPIGHSLSPKLHNYWFKMNNINAVYDKKEINEEDLKFIISEIKEKKNKWYQCYRSIQKSSNSLFR